MDNIKLTDLDDVKLVEKTKQTNVVLRHANMKVKRWIFSGEDQGDVKVGNLTDSLTLEDVKIE